MSRFSDIQKILKEESEEWLAYLHGQQLEELSHVRDSQPRYTGFFLQSAIFFYHLLRLFIKGFFIKKPKSQKVDFYFYAGTGNEANSLVGTAKSLSQNDKIVLAESSNNQLLNGANQIYRFEQLKINLTDILSVCIVFLLNAPSLYLRLRKKDKILVNKFFVNFCHSYMYLTVFYQRMKRYSPDYIVVSNDHNVDCRSLVAVATYLEIKTVYMQHASVSSLFPALTVSYAFLDGQSALNTYQQCEENKSPFFENKEQTKIFLSGQKKLLTKRNSSTSTQLGLAINTLDDTGKVIELVNKLTDKDVHVSLRWHPGQKPQDILGFHQAFNHSEMVTLSDPKQQGINEFFAEINCLVSVNSSIHLEAAVVGIPTIYYELQQPEIEDYYGYVKNGLAKKADSYEELLALISQDELLQLNDDAIQYYSASFNTQWYGREGELVATTLLALQAGSNWRTHFGAKEL